VRLFRRLNNLCRLLSREKGYDSGSAARQEWDAMATLLTVIPQRLA